jgi:hypothetical protein
VAVRRGDADFNASIKRTGASDRAGFLFGPGIGAHAAAGCGFPALAAGRQLR